MKGVFGNEMEIHFIQLNSDSISNKARFDLFPIVKHVLWRVLESGFTPTLLSHSFRITSLQDQLPVINNYTHNGIVFVNELRDFMKEMASLKKEYAHRMDQLAKRYLKQKEKLGASLLGSESSPASSTTTVDYGSVYRVWDSLLTQSEKIANIYSTLSESITTDIADPLKSVALKQDEARKKHLNFAQKLMEERNKAYTDKDKSKEKYEQSCDQVEAARIKYEKAPDEKNQERVRCQQVVVFMIKHFSAEKVVASGNYGNEQY